MSGRLAARRIAPAFCCAAALWAIARPARADEPPLPSTVPLAAAIERAVADDMQLRAARAELDARRQRAADAAAEAANAVDARRRGIGSWLRGRVQRGAGEGGVPAADASALEVAERAVERARLFALERAVGAVIEQQREVQRVDESRRPVAAAPTADTAALADALERWADAWRSQRISGYVASYAQDYAPAGTTRERWLARRAARLAQPGPFEITIDNPRWEQTGADLAEVRFTQRYRSALYADVVDKQLVWRRGPDGWRIVVELMRNERVVRGTAPRAVPRQAENG